MTPEIRKIGTLVYTNDGERRMCWSCYLVGTTWQNEYGTAWCEACQGEYAIKALAEAELRLEAAEMEAERRENILLGMVAEEIGFGRAHKIWGRLAALAGEEKP